MQKYANNAIATLTSNMSVVVLSCTVDPAYADKFPVAGGGDTFKVTIQKSTGEYEIVKVKLRTAGSAALQQLERAQDGTEALSFAAGDAVVALRFVASDIEKAVNHPDTAEAAHSASAISFTPAGAIEATTVQQAIEEVSAAASEGLSHTVSKEDIQKGVVTSFTTAGAAPNLTITPSPALDAYALWVRFQVKVHVDISGNPTLNVSGKGAKYIKRYNEAGEKVPLSAKAGTLIDVVFDGVDFVAFSAPPVAQVPTAYPGDVALTYTPVKPDGARRILVQGQAIALADFPTLSFLWCGGAYNANANPDLQADFFYRCADPANPNGTRTNAGSYLKLPDAGYFLRLLNISGVGVNANRNPFKYEADDNKAHSHRVSVQAGTNNGENLALTDRGVWDYNVNRTTEMSGGSESRPKNRGVYEWICH